MRGVLVLHGCPVTSNHTMQWTELSRPLNVDPLSLMAADSDIRAFIAEGQPPGHRLAEGSG
jgi:hypothetical protein